MPTVGSVTSEMLASGFPAGITWNHISEGQVEVQAHNQAGRIDVGLTVNGKKKIVSFIAIPYGSGYSYPALITVPIISEMHEPDGVDPSLNIWHLKVDTSLLPNNAVLVVNNSQVSTWPLASREYWANPANTMYDIICTKNTGEASFDKTQANTVTCYATVLDSTNGAVLAEITLTRTA